MTCVRCVVPEIIYISLDLSRNYSMVTLSVRMQDHMLSEFGTTDGKPQKGASHVYHAWENGYVMSGTRWLTSTRSGIVSFISMQLSLLIFN